MTALTNGARAEWRRYGKGKQTKQGWNEYVIYPPTATPFLPGDDAITQAVRTLSGTRLAGIIRFHDRDLLVIQVRENVFGSKASKEVRKLATEFLMRVSAMSLPDRHIPPLAQEACDAYMNKNAIRSVEWRGNRICATSIKGYRFEATPRSRSLYKRELARLARACSGFLPFYYEAAQQ